MVHTLRLDNYSPTPRKLVLGTNSSYGTESIKIERGAGWDGLNLTATWHIPGREEPLRVALLDGDAMDVPPEVTKEAKDGVLVLAGLASGVQRASCNVEYLILEQAGVYGGTDAEPTPELAAQVLEAALQAKADAEAAAEDSAAAKANADKAQADAEKAQQAAENAAADAAKAGPYAEAALAAQEAAEAASDDAQAAARAASASETAAAANEKAAAASEKAAAASAVAAAGSAAQAEAQKTAAEKSASDAQGYMQTASGAATAANASAENAAGSKAAAASSATAAEESKQAAVESEVKAAESEQAAKASEQAAAKSAQAALESKTAAATSEVNAAASAKKAQDVSDSLPADYTAMSGDVGTLKNQMQRAYPDDSTIGENTWSSKHIIDMLCPEIKESGNPVLCYPVAGYPLGVKASWEPVQEGSGTPSPENIRPIKGRDSVRVERCGENLLNIKPFNNKDTHKGITYEYVPDGGIHVSGTALTSVDSPTFPVWLLPPGKYFGLELGSGISANIMVQRNGKNLWLNAKGAFEILAGDVTKYWYAIVSAGATVDKTVYPYIVPGTTAPTTYTPYIGQTNTLTLPETVYGGEVDAVNGDGQDTWKPVILNGTESWFSWGINAHNPAVTGFYTYDITDYDAINVKGICSHLAPSGLDVWGGRRAGIGFAKTGESRYFMYCVPTSLLPDISAGHEVASLKAYIAAQNAAGTPVQIAYKLATPTPFTATGAQPIPALAGANTILTDADSATVTGRADPIKRITDLEEAVASQT